MSEHAALNSLIVENLPDLEAAAHQLETVITPMVQDEVLRVVAEFIERQGWAGESDDLDELWCAPTQWHDPDGGGDKYLLYFKLQTAAADAHDDRFWLSTITGAGRTRIGLYLVSDRLPDARLGKLFAADAELIQQLQAHGFVYDIAGGRALYLPLTIDRAQLLADLHDDTIDEAIVPVVRTLDEAAAVVPLLAPIVDAIGGE